MYLKKLYKIYTAFFVISACQLGCKKFEEIPVDGRTVDIVFDKTDLNGNLAEQALNNLYNYLPKGFNRLDGSFLDAATDDGISSQLSSSIEIFSMGIQSPVQLIDDAFATNYTGIYHANVFLANIDVVPIIALTKQYWKAEARFIRAMCYFELIKRYGGVPLIGDKILTAEDNANIPRSGYADCVNYIVNECNVVSPLLRKDPLTTTDVGRITQGAALALKARTLLYAASPLNNPTNDIVKWQAAANAAADVIALAPSAGYVLNNAAGTTNLTTPTTTPATPATKASFTAAFTTRNDKEVILGYQQAKNQNLESANAPVGYTTELYSSSGGTSPTQDLVDAFPTINGKPITSDIYNATTNTGGYNAANPYANRDPRLSATVFFNGQYWLGRPVETFEGGLDKPGGAIVQTKTGYYLRKFLPDLTTSSNYGSVDHNFVIFRYAEVLLNYAEAINEASPSNTALSLARLYEIRRRAGINAGTPGTYGITATTQSQVRDAIRLERRLELAFEEHRFWDERRWKTAEVDFNKTLHGITITKTGNTFTYAIKNVTRIEFAAPRMYLYPIAYSELQKNSALIQNPNY